MQSVSEISGFVDIHCHILPGLDDGSQSMDETLKMLYMADKEGIRHMVCTPHYKVGRHNAGPEQIALQIKKVEELAKENEISIQFYPGNEILYSEEAMEHLEEGRVDTMNGTAFCLVEFFPDDSYKRIIRGLRSVRDLDYFPILAHAERYECLRKDWHLVEELKDYDIGIQINASTVTGSMGFRGKQFVKKLLQEQLVDYLGTDAHGCRERRPEMRKCAEYMYKHYDKEYAEGILFKNAIERLLVGGRHEQ